jgi:hypothetical protein
MDVYIVLLAFKIMHMKNDEDSIYVKVCRCVFILGSHCEKFIDI